MDYRSNGCGVMPDYSFECDLDGLFGRTYAMGKAPQTIACPGKIERLENDETTGE
jgi:hypothetical protein